MRALAFALAAALPAHAAPPTGAAGPGIHAAHALRPPEGARPGPRVRLPAPPTEGRPEVVVYGYLAYWAGSVETVPYASLTHLAIFNVDLRADGTLADTARWTTVAPRAVELAAPHGVRVHLTLTCFDADVMRAVLPSASRRATLVDQLGDLVESAGAHGVSVDCEGMPASLRGDFVTFLAALDARVPEISVALPSVDWSDAYDYAAIATHADQLFIMGYGYHWSGGDPGPNAPLEGGAGWPTWSLAWSVEDYREKGVPDEQIVLGLPLYGHRWPTTSTAVPGESTGVASTVTMENAVPEADAAGRCWDAHTLTPYALPSSRSQLWYDDTESVGLKAAWAVEQGLGGFGFWALDYEGADPDFWATIDRVSRLEEGEAGDPGESSDTGAAGGGGGEGGGGGADGGGGGAGADGGCDGADPTGSSDTGAGEGGLGGRYGKGTGCAAAPVALIAGLPLLLGWAARGRRRSA
ncbi:MAG: hypothetical protein RL071_3708 [Pseudomonadota bacterium]